MSSLLSALTHFITSYIASAGYIGVGVLMMLEATGIPIPSEVIMPFAGFMVVQGNLVFVGAVIAGAVGDVIGSLIAYSIGYYGGRSLIESYGKYILLSKKDLALAERFFNQRGSLTVFIGRILPVVRTYISFPAGIAKMKLTPFVIYTAIGTLIWTSALAWVGVRLGEHWETIRAIGHKFDVAIAVLIIAGIVWYIWWHIKLSKS